MRLIAVPGGSRLESDRDALPECLPTEGAKEPIVEGSELGIRWLARPPPELDRDPDTSAVKLAILKK